MHDRSRLIANDKTKLDMSNLANKHCISTLQTDTHVPDFFLTAIDTMQTSTKKEYRDARRRSGEAVWSCRQGTATCGPRPVSMPRANFSPHVARSAQFVAANTVGPGLGMVIPASPSRRICTRFDIRMETTALHAYKEQFVTTTSIAPCGHAQSKTLARTKDRCADL